LKNYLQCASTYNTEQAREMKDLLSIGWSG
jgi:hypothetical protein